MNDIKFNSFFIDSHCHLDFLENQLNLNEVVRKAHISGVKWIIIPSVQKSNFELVSELTKRFKNCAFSLGIHPLFVKNADESDLKILRKNIELSLKNDNFIAVGEIGLDFYTSNLREGYLRDKQEFFFIEQLKYAKEFDLPVILHVRKSQDIILKYLRSTKVNGGIVHAFNGSKQQAKFFLDHNFLFGFGGSLSYEKAINIRNLASYLSLKSIVLETDSPDMSPKWIKSEINTPEQILKIAKVL